MNRRAIFCIFVLLSLSHLSAQKPLPDSSPNKNKLSGLAPVTNSSPQLQQLLLLGRKEQLELNRQEQQRVLLEQQKKELAEKEKQLLELKFRNKQHELEQDRQTQSEILQKNRLEARLKEIQKDKQINEQKDEISNNRKWNLVLLSGFLIVGAFAVIVYYSQRRTKRLNEVVSQQRNELEQMGMVKDTILGVVSHDLHTPVNTLLSFTELIKEGNIQPDKLEQYLDQIGSTLTHTSSLMNNLLNWSASQMQGFKAVIEPTSVADAVSPLTLLFADRLNAKNIRFINTIPAGITVMADANMLELILRNLVSNAIKFTAPGGTVIASAESADFTVTISITDSGVGMSTGKMKKFNADKMEQWESTPGTAKEKGTGLGLLLCKTFSKLMMGNIYVSEHQNGPGCRFSLELPKG